MSGIWGRRPAPLPKRTPGGHYQPALAAEDHAMLAHLVEATPRISDQVAKIGRDLADDLRKSSRGAADPELAASLLQVVYCAAGLYKAVENHRGQASEALMWHWALNSLLDAMGVAAVELTALERL